MKNILKTFVLASLALALCTTTFAQEKNGKKKMTQEQVSAVQAKDIAASLGLDDKTTEKFVQTFCSYRAEIRTANQEKKAVTVGINKKDMNEEQVEAQIKAQFAHSRKVLDIREKYYDEYRQILNPRQIQRVYALEKRQSEKMREAQKKRKANANNKANNKAKAK